MKSIAFLRDQLAERALAVCQTYLPNGRRSGQYWVTGDLAGNKGRSLYVRLTGRAGKWTDGATGEHGDLLDIIAHTQGHTRFADIVAEAERFLALPPSEPLHPDVARSAQHRTHSARCLFAASRPLQDTRAEQYLRDRGLTGSLQYASLRFHPDCYVRLSTGARLSYPALIAAITDLAGEITGVHRTWLDPRAPGKAPLPEPRRSMGAMIGHAVRFGPSSDVVIAGEGLETVLSLRCVLPWIPAEAALTATHLGLLALPPGLKRLYIARDNDPAGLMAWRTLSAKAQQQGIAPYALIPRLKDWNDDLRLLGFHHTHTLALSQLSPDDAPRQEPRNRLL